MKKAIITVLGKDKVGIISGVANMLSDNNVNILDISQTILQDMFCMMMIVDIDKVNIPFAQFTDKMAEMGNSIGMSIRAMHEDIFNSMHRI